MRCEADRSEFLTFIKIVVIFLEDQRNLYYKINEMLLKWSHWTDCLLNKPHIMTLTDTQQNSINSTFNAEISRINLFNHSVGLFYSECVDLYEGKIGFGGLKRTICLFMQYCRKIISSICIANVYSRSSALLCKSSVRFILSRMVLLSAASSTKRHGFWILTSGKSVFVTKLLK